MTSELTQKWSDGIDRIANSGQSSLTRGILKYVEDLREEELLRVQWENEYLREKLAYVDGSNIAEARGDARPKVKAAAKGA